MIPFLSLTSSTFDVTIVRPSVTKSSSSEKFFLFLRVESYNRGFRRIFIQIRIEIKGQKTWSLLGTHIIFVVDIRLFILILR